MKRIISFLMITVLIALTCPVQVFSADTATELSTKQAELQKKFNIDIKFPKKSDGSAAINVNSLNMLEQALDTVTPNLVKQVSEYYKEKNGRRLLFSYVQAPSHLTGYAGSDQAILAGFDDNSSLIELYIPRSSGEIIATGESPINILHEFGHAFHLMYTAKYGFDKMQKEWSAFNGSYSYKQSNIYQNPSNKAFITGYAATSFHEDVAETFAHSFVRYRAGQGFTGQLKSNDKTTGLGRKVAYVEKMLTAYISDAQPAVDNFRRVYKAKTSVTYQGMKFSGEHLQYIGYPQPRYILNGSMKSLNKKRDEALWIKPIGGWYVKTTQGEEILVFPGGYWSKLGSSFEVPAA